MKSIQISIIALFTLALFPIGDLFAQDVISAPPPSLYSDKRGYKAGDIVTILLMENTQGSNEASTNTDIDQQFKAKNQATGLLDFLPSFGAEMGIASDQKSKGGTTRQGSLKGRIAAIITEVHPNGTLQLEGQRTTEINGEIQIMILRGVVRPKDIRADNSVYSYLIADANIVYKGKGGISAAAKPGVISRFINWLF